MSRTIRPRSGLTPVGAPARRSAEAARRPSPGLRCVHRWVEAQVSHTPEAIAVADGERALTYRDLNDRANRLAWHLRALGVGPEVLVGLCVSRSVDMVAALLAVLKAGGAYIPLDPAYPPDRLAFMIDDARPAVLLTEESLRGGLPEDTAGVLCLDDAASWAATGPDENLPGGAGLANLAYVIYTSGSTGKPKGVQVHHAALSNLLASMRTIFGINPDDALLAVTTLSFDIAALELFLPLISGARVALADRETAADGRRLIDRLERDGITFLQATPATWRLLLQAGWRGTPRLNLLCGGEAMPRALADQLLDKGSSLWNLYGPTETTVWSSAWRVEPGDGPISIGRPIARTRLYVLNRAMEPVPAGVSGELYIGGLGVARGYLGRPGLTAERFLPDPFSGEPGARLYRTGDLARWRPDGSLECLGRVDHQVKVRGFRVELGEIEAALASHPDIRQAAVAARDFGADDTRLVAFLTPAADADVPAASELRPFLKGTLPDYMIPSSFVAIVAMPMTPNGKVDRAALPFPDALRPVPGAAYTPPRNPIEEMLAGIWASVLGLDRVGAFDNFFDLGGHSLLATQVASRIRDALGVDLPLRDLFGDPTVAGVSRWIEERLRGDGDEDSVPLIPLEQEGPLPASFPQEALWFLDQLDPGQATFNITIAGRVRGPLDLGILTRCLFEIVRRHDTLRTTFDAVDGRPVQVVASRIELPMSTTDLRALDGPVREAEARRLAIREARQPFDLARGPLARVQVLTMGDDDHAILLTMHHIIGDGWSLGVAAGEMAVLYDAFSRGEPSPLDPLPVQYTDYSAWQHRRLQGARLERLVAYWTRQLAGAPPLELPTDRPRPAIRTSRGAFLPLEIPAEQSALVRALGRRAGATPFMILLAALKVLLHRYSGQDDIVVGSPIANRGRSEVEGLIGYFVNMLALRTDLAGDPSFLELVRRVRDVALSAYEHQELPLEKVIEALRPPRDPSRSPLFQVMFVLQNNRVPELSHPDLTLGPLDLDEGTGTAKFDLTLAIGDGDGAFSGGFEFNTDLFDPETIARMARHFLRLLGEVVADPERRVSALSMMEEEERGLILDRGRGPLTEPADDRPVHRLFEDQARRAPDAVAVEAAGRSLSYRELDERSNRLARALRARGIGPDSLVAIGMERSLELAVGLLGILKAGGAFVPLDPDYPPDRLAAMLEDARAAILLTQESLRDRWPAVGTDTIRLDTDWPSIELQDASRLDGDPTSEHAAYVIYTSGSTGEPRGVVVRHGGLLNHNRAAAELFGLSPDDRVLQFSALSFDIAIEELFPAWISGAAVVFRDESTPIGPTEFSAWLAAHRITVVDLPTVYWHAWVEGLAAMDGRLPDPLRLAIVGGEKASARRYADWLAVGGDRIRWINTYGPTEATVIATAYEPRERPRRGVAIPELPIGRPIANTRIHLLDARMEPVPIGLPGELYIGGEGLARGYLHRPGRTAERFVPDPFADRPGSRLFRTGDRARWRPDGQLEFLGRVDHQLKIRGYRVEPGEVEAVLRRYPGVAEAVVGAREDAAGRRRLVAHVVPRGPDGLDVAELRRWLRAALPEYMVPSAFVPIEAIPISPAGKIDRKALPDPGPGPLDPAAEYVPPRNPMEETLARAWAEVLELERVGIHDDFFELGGHSLQSVQLVARLAAVLGRPVSVKTVFQAPTVAMMAEALAHEAPATLGDRGELAEMARWLLEAAPPALPAHVSIEGRPFLPLFATGELATVDAVAVSYFPSALLHALGLDRGTVIHDWCGDRPVIADVRQTPLGRIGTVLIPRFEDQLYLDRADLLDALVDAVRLAREIGATAVSLTGLLPSASDYGRALSQAIAGRDLPRITTGHATTTSAVVLAIRRALEEGGRDLDGEHVGFIGLGSIGVATLRLLLSCLPHPARLSLCDVYAKEARLASLRRELIDELGYRGEVRLLASGHEVPDELYQSSLIVGATNVAEILDIDRLAPGTIVVDDSAPHCFRADSAMRRLADQGDILITEGGLLLAPEPLPIRAFVPDDLDPWLRAGLVQLVAGSDPRLITGCVLSGLLTARLPHLSPTIGLVDRRTALDHYETLTELGFQAPPLQLGGSPIDPRVISVFRERHGRRDPSHEDRDRWT